jgi:NADPH:quinone reductase-like Zn-dependent oxidoreductase
MYGAGKIKPFAVKMFALEDTAAAIATLANREAVGKVAISIRD